MTIKTRQELIDYLKGCTYGFDKLPLPQQWIDEIVAENGFWLDTGSSLPEAYVDEIIAIEYVGG